MCGSGKSNDGKAHIYLGYYGASLDLEDMTYCVEGDYKKDTTKEEMRNYIITHYSYGEFIDKILECIDNGSEE